MTERQETTRAIDGPGDGPRDDSGAEFLSGGGTMGALMRAHDWSDSPVGPPETWPQSLRTVISLLLNSKFPMFIAWGPELAFLYNDAYLPIFGAKHPQCARPAFRQGMVGYLVGHQPAGGPRPCRRSDVP